MKSGIGDVVTTPVNNSIGVWSTDGGTLHLVARQGALAPGCPNGEVFLSFSQVALPDQGGVVILANLTSGFANSSNNLGIWAVDSSGQLQLIVRLGDTLDVNGKTIKTISFLAPATSAAGQTRYFSQSTGNLIYKATFTDGTWGYYQVTLR